MKDFADIARHALAERGYSMRAAARETFFDVAYVSRVLNRKQAPSPKFARELDRLLDTGTVMQDAAGAELEVSPGDDELEAIEFTRRVQSSDVGAATVDRLDVAFTDLATRYNSTPPQLLLQQVRKHTGYVLKLLDAKKTLREHRRLLVAGGWLSLLGATLHIDLNHDAAATAWLQTAADLACEAEHAEIGAWCYETEAWRRLTEGDHRQALTLSQTAQRIAPAGSSALIQATAQEGRARARMGQAPETYEVIERVQRLSSDLGTPDNIEHHYQYDPTKAVAYTATTLAWLGDAGAEPYAREVIARLSSSEDPATWPRRVASANLDLSLALIVSDRMDEACDRTRRAIESGRVVPSNHWRALEVVKAVEARQLPEASDLTEAYQALTSAPVGWET